MVKILHIIKSLGRGGAEMLLPETLKVHDREKFQFHYIYFLPWKNQMVEAIETAGGKVTCLEAKDNIRLLQKAGAIADYCREHEIDLMHAHLPWAGFVARRAHKKTGIPLLYTEHNMQERYHKVTKILNKLSFNTQSLALGVSEEVTQSIEKNITPKIQVKTLLNGVNTEAFQRNPQASQELKTQWGIPVDAKVIGVVAVFRFQKRLKEWLEVFQEISKTTKQVYGLIVGAGPLEKEIKAKWKTLGLEKRVIFAGLQTDVKPFLNIMDIFMMTSSFEGLPIALLEAMSMQCAVAATRAGGVGEVIRHKKDGVTVPVEEWKNLAGPVSKWLQNENELQAYQHAARKRVQEAFSMKAMVAQLEEYYEKEERK